jgi:hypothetical protein
VNDVQFVSGETVDWKQYLPTVSGVNQGRDYVNQINAILNGQYNNGRGIPGYFSR